MKILKCFYLLAIFLLIPIVSTASKTKPGIIGKANLSKEHNYTFLDTTTNGKYFYALYYISQGDENSKATVACFRDTNNQGFYNCWYYQKLKTTPNRILSTDNYLICLDEIRGTVELYTIRESGALSFIEQGNMVFKYKTVVEGNQAFIVER
jgi:hypothetical protein